MLAENRHNSIECQLVFKFFSMCPSVLKLEINQHYGFVTQSVAILHNTQRNLSFKKSDICLMWLLIF